MCVICFVFSEQLRWGVIVRFVDIGEIDDHHYLNLLFLNAASPQYGGVIAKWLRIRIMCLSGWTVVTMS